MAFQKQVIIPGFNATVNYHRIERIDRMDNLVKEAVFKLNSYTDQTTAKASNVGGYFHSGVIIVRGETFDTYFSRAALAASNNSVHGQAYQLIKDLIAAKNTTTPTDAQKVLIQYGQVDVNNSFGGLALFQGATDA